ncbi:MAG: hypothetical protein M1817_003109 [Caeruleum heppii]|nr:MAG: hypothetical protein M1817_003109 [Caeruleum heppii]
MTPAFIRKLEETVALSCTLAKRDGVPCRTFAANPQALTDVLWQPFRDVIFAELGVTVTVEQAGYAAAAFVLTSLVVKTIEDQVFNDGPSLSFGWLLPKDKVEEAKGSPTPESSDEERKDCPKDAEKPRCSMDTCQGVEVEGSPNKECSTGEHKTCECSTPIKPLYDSFGLDETFVTAQQEYIQALIEAPDVASETPEEPSDEPKPDCGKRSDDNPLRDPSQEVALSQPAMETAFKSFCESNKGKELGNGIGTMYGPDGTDKCSSCPQNFRIRAMRAISDECGDFDNKINADDCLSAYGAITNGCDTETLTAKKGGYISLGCVAWTLEGSGGLGEPKGLGDPPPAEGPDAYKMKLHQVMEGADSTLTWTVFDGEGAEVGSDKATTLNDEHDVSGIIKGAPLDLQVTISRPTYKDETNIWFTYGGLSPSWSTGTTGGKAAVSSDEGYSCGKVDPGMWRPLNGGFERDLECTYLGIED